MYKINRFPRFAFYRNKNSNEHSKFWILTTSKLTSTNMFGAYLDSPNICPDVIFPDCVLRIYGPSYGQYSETMFLPLSTQTYNSKRRHGGEGKLRVLHSRHTHTHTPSWFNTFALYRVYCLFTFFVCIVRVQWSVIHLSLTWLLDLQTEGCLCAFMRTINKVHFN